MASIDLSMSSLDQAGNQAAMKIATRHPPVPPNRQSGILTPPITPDKASEREKRRRSIGKDSINLIKNPSQELTDRLSIGVGLGIDPRRVVEDMLERNIDVGPLQFVPELPRPYRGAYRLSQHVIGHGAWSKVFSASEVAGASPITPPHTPPYSSLGVATRLLAVKKLDRRDGKAIIENEARILTYLHSHPGSLDHLVPFYGFEADKSWIVMGLIPQTLEDHVRSKASLPVPTSTMFDPVIGRRDWGNLALDLIRSLEYLHGKNCVHGDIKPANVLLQAIPNEGGGIYLKPLLCDFSSSRVETNPPGPVEEVSAVTAEYTAPELLRALNPRRRRSAEDFAVTTSNSDIFALAVTLLVAATGQSPYAQAQLQIQKNVMAEEGLPIAYAQNSDQAARVCPGQLVDEVLKIAVNREPAKRICAMDWIPHAQKAISLKGTR